MKKIIFIFTFILLITKSMAYQNHSAIDPVNYFQQIAKQIRCYKYQVQRCYEMMHQFTNCSGGINGIDPDITESHGNIAWLRTIDGVITVLPVPMDAILSTDSYISTPSINYHTFSWTASGMSVDKGYIEF